MKYLFVLLFTIAVASEDAKDEFKELFEMKIDQGILRGFKEKSLNGREFFSFMGIPFAKPPVGNLRFKEPEPADPWTGTLKAVQPQQICPQFDMVQSMKFNYSVVGSEDCLYLNVFTPKLELKNKDAKLPVMVFIHGGGYASGSSIEYAPYGLLNEEIVLVVIQYRLGPLGFLSTGDPILSGNYGLKDQVMALKWVQKNIQRFGGDSGRVTIFGESAGGGSVHHLVLSPWSKGLFHGAISQSGSAASSWGVNRNPKQAAKELGKDIGCPYTDSTQYRNCMMQKDPKELIESTKGLMKWANLPMVFMPVVDGDFLPREPLALLHDKQYNKVNYISGITKNEGIMFCAFGSLQETFDEILTDFDKVGPSAVMVHNEKDAVSISKRMFEHYLEGKKLTKESYMTLEKMYTDQYFSVGHDLATKFHSEDTEIKTYRYQLDWSGQISLMSLLNISGFENDVSHADDLFFLFPGGPVFGTLEDPQDVRMQDIFIKLWTNFAATGNPTPDDSLGFRWPPATQQEFHQLVLTPEPYMSEYVNTKGRDFLNSLQLTESKILRDLEASTSQKKDEL